MIEAQAATIAARLRLQLIQAESEDDDDSIIEEPKDREDQVRAWVQTSVGSMDKEPAGEHIENRPVSKANMEECGNRDLAKAIVEAVRSATTKELPPQPDYMHQLPTFEGDCTEWVAFKAVYEDTAPLFSSAQNMARRRRALKGQAREGVRSQLYSESTPEEVMESLRRCYGRADALVLAE
ncbi:DUF1759 domain-containing protein, partial [Acinetobacter baumannii]